MAVHLKCIGFIGMCWCHVDACVAVHARLQSRFCGCAWVRIECARRYRGRDGVDWVQLLITGLRALVAGRVLCLNRTVTAHVHSVSIYMTRRYVVTACIGCGV